MKPIASIFAVLATLVTLASSAEEARPGDRGVIEKTIRDSIGWALTKDRPLAESVIARDDRLFMFNPDSEITVGWDQWVKRFDFWMDPRFKATKMEIREMRIDVSRSGDVAWWSCILDDLGEWDGRPIGWKDTRWTGILEKRAGRWLIVQMHFSFASDKVVAEAKARLQSQGADAAQAALDYAEGWFDGDAARVERVLHPEFVRRIAAVTVAGDDFFWQQDRERFLEMTRQGGDKATPADQRQIKVTVRDLARTTATVRVDSAYHVEHLSMVKLRDRWQIVNVLWENVPNDKKEAPIDFRVLADYAGTYRSESGAIWQVIVEGSRIFLKPADEPRIEIFPESETEFFTKGYKSGVTFVREASGSVTRLVKRVNYRDFSFDKIE
ncbi:MAG: nuclear transport factor 2 family protein [Acidobacteriota bacterium]